MNDIKPGAVVGFVGLGKMGTPMASRLAEAGYSVRRYDVNPQNLQSWAERAVAGTAASGLSTVAEGAAAVVLMLPGSAVVRRVVTGLLPAFSRGL
jgi:3-hydroxyisobutyrate dehydrogenase-like beta-hydroxyacid dehydrogenase